MVRFCETCECVWTDGNPYCPVCMNTGQESGYEHLWRAGDPAPRNFYKPTDKAPVAVASSGFLNDTKKKQIEEKWEHAGTLTLDDVDFTPEKKS